MILSSLMIVIAVLAALSAALVSIIVGRSERESKYKRNFILLSMLTCLWIVSNILFSVVTEGQRYAFALASYGLAMLLVVQLLAFCVRFVWVNGLSSNSSVGVYLPGVLFALASLIPGVVGRGVTGIVIHTNRPMFMLYALCLFGYIAASVGVLLMARRRAKHVVLQRLNIILIGMLASGLIGVYCNLILPLVGSYTFALLGPACTVIFISCVAYAIIRHGLFNIRLTLVRTVTYGAVVLSLIVLYFGIAFFIAYGLQAHVQSMPQLIMNVTIALIIAVSFQPLRHFFNRLTSKVFYKDSYLTEDFYADLNKVLGSTTDLRHMLQRAIDEIVRKLHAEQAFFYVYYGDEKHISTGTNHHSRLPYVDARMLDDYVRTEMRQKGAIITDLVKNEPIRRMLVSHKVFITLPLVHASGDVVGYLMLGYRQSGDYAHRDIHVLETVSNELIIAIQNALSVEVVKELNDSLQQRIDNATKELRASNEQLRLLDEAKDEFVSMASHQLRTPLTSVKGYISMLLDGDAGPITETQKHFLSEAFTSSERMVRLINDFLNVSRLQTGKFIIDRREVDIHRIISEEVRSLRTTAAQRQLKIIVKIQRDLPLLFVDENKIRQVLMNFIDNALYYSPASTIIHVNARLQDGAVEVRVIDSGIGVPRNEQKHLFEKFYRASNARKQRPDGTGVGLFLAHKVITAHGGKLIFESEEGNGSTFGFTLPVRDLNSAAHKDSD